MDNTKGDWYIHLVNTTWYRVPECYGHYMEDGIIGVTVPLSHGCNLCAVEKQCESGQEKVWKTKQSTLES